MSVRRTASVDTERRVGGRRRAVPPGYLDAVIALILKRDGDRDLDSASNLKVEESLAILELLRFFQERTQSK